MRGFFIPMTPFGVDVAHEGELEQIIGLAIGVGSNVN